MSAPNHLFLLFCLLAVASGTTFFSDSFDSDEGWVHTAKSGKMALSKGKFRSTNGLQTQNDASFYSVSKALPAPFSNEGKDLVVSFSVTHEQNIDCGGGYLKLLPAFDQTTFSGDTPYLVMFGPDICGATKKIHFILSRNGKNHLWKKEPRCESDQLTHFYTFVIRQDGTYEVLKDFVAVESGKLEDDWDLLPPKTIVDPEDKKPADWVDQAEIVDETDKKPEDWDAEPATIPDPDATKPDDWDEEEDGEWEAPTLPNPKHKGEWRAKRIPNPKYKGEWKPRQIANPDYTPDTSLYKFEKEAAVVGFDLWQVKSGTIFDNILITDSLDEAKAAFASKKQELEDEKKAQQKSTEAAAAKETAAAKEDDDDDDDDDDDEEDEKDKGGARDEL